MRISDWSSDVCSSDLTVEVDAALDLERRGGRAPREPRGEGDGLPHPDEVDATASRSARRTERWSARPMAVRGKTGADSRAMPPAMRTSTKAYAEAKATAHTLAFKLSPSSRSEAHTSELQSLMRISYAVFCLKKKLHLTHLRSTRHHIHTK